MFTSSAAPLPRRALGGSGIEVSIFSLGSFRTYDRMTTEESAAVLRTAREHGIDFLEVARYDDETGNAPIPSGYGEVAFGEAFRRSAWPRDEVVIAEKLWWDAPTLTDELDASLLRMKLDHVDFVCADPLPEGKRVEDAVAAIGELITAGKARAWGVANWQAAQIAEAGRAAHELGVAPPCAAQLPYNLVQRDWVEGPEMAEALDACQAVVVASYALLGGVLSGKYARGERGRMTGLFESSPNSAAGLPLAEPLAVLSAELGETSATLAMTFAMANPRVATTLFGATRPEQVTENLRASRLLATLSDGDLERLRSIKVSTPT